VLSQLATNCFGALRSRCGACCGFCWVRKSGPDWAKMGCHGGAL